MKKSMIFIGLSVFVLVFNSFSAINFYKIGTSGGTASPLKLGKKIYQIYMKRDFNSLIAYMLPMKFAHKAKLLNRYKPYLNTMLKRVYKKIIYNLRDYNFPRKLVKVKIIYENPEDFKIKIRGSNSYIKVKRCKSIYVIFNGNKVRIIHYAFRFNNRWYVADL